MQYHNKFEDKYDDKKIVIFFAIVLIVFITTVLIITGIKENQSVYSEPMQTITTTTETTAEEITEEKEKEKEEGKEEESVDEVVGESEEEKTEEETTTELSEEERLNEKMKNPTKIFNKNGIIIFYDGMEYDEALKSSKIRLFILNNTRNKKEISLNNKNSKTF